MWQVFSRIFLAIFFCVGLLLITAHAAASSASDKISNPTTKKSAFIFESEQLLLHLRPRSLEQMAGFFEARGFPARMIERLSGYCFFTVVIKNKMNDVLWLDLGGWQFFTHQHSLSRMPRSVWPPLWKSENIPLASQATFRWTLLPETLNFYAHESEGGNIILQKTSERFSLRARFGKGEGREAIMASIDNLQCADAMEGSQ